MLNVCACLGVCQVHMCVVDRGTPWMSSSETTPSSFETNPLIAWSSATRLDLLAGEPRDTAVSVFPVLGLQAHTTKLGLLLVLGVQTQILMLQGAPRSLLCLHPQHWDYKYMLPCLLYMWVLESKCRSPCLQNKHSTFPRSHTLLILL